jgi:hypothetical protein
MKSLWGTDNISRMITRAIESDKHIAFLKVNLEY